MPPASFRAMRARPRFQRLKGGRELSDEVKGEVARPTARLGVACLRSYLSPASSQQLAAVGRGLCRARAETGAGSRVRAATTRRTSARSPLRNRSRAGRWTSIATSPRSMAGARANEKIYVKPQPKLKLGACDARRRWRRSTRRIAASTPRAARTAEEKRGAIQVQGRDAVGGEAS